MPKEYKYRKSFTFEGVRYYVRGDTLDEVYEKKQEKIAQLKSGRIVYSGNMLVREWAYQAIDTYKVNANEENLKNMKMRIEKHILSKIGGRTLKSVTAIQCQQILNAQDGMSYSHITKLHFIFKMALKNHLIPFDPTEDLVQPNGRKGHRRSINDNGRKHLLIVCGENPLFIPFEPMIYCGCRPSEAIGVIGRDIAEEDGKPVLHICGTKTENSDRYVPVPSKLYEKLKSVGPFAPAAPNHRGRPHTESSYDRLVKSLKRSMNISMGCRVYRNQLVPLFPLAEDFVPYDLRHTYCTDLARAGVDIRTVQRLMGHSNIFITADIYTHVSKKDILSAAE